MFKVLEPHCEPVRSTKYSAYVDLFSREDVVIGAGETKIVKLGVKINIPKLYKRLGFFDYQVSHTSNRIKICKFKSRNQLSRFLKSHYLEVALRSSLAVKGLIIANGIGVIDFDYVSHCKLNKKLNNGHCEHFKPKLKG